MSRTVKALLPPEAYAALKASRQKNGTTAVASVLVAEEAPAPRVTDAEPETVDQAKELDPEDAATLALDDADDFGVTSDEEPSDEEDEASVTDVFTELVPLTGVGDLGGHSTVAVKPFAADLLPTSAYMLVDKVVELDARPLRDFPDLGSLEDAELERQGICLFTSPRAAKRQCGRSQRVIKVPDTAVFGRTSHYLLARGITRLVMDGSVMALGRVAEQS